jgi:hypothetical protein
MPLHQRIERKFKGDGVARATDSAVSAMPAFQFVLFDDLGRLADALIDFQDVGGTIADTFAATDTLTVVKNRRHSLTPFR